jgi:hypothetical protein
MGLASRNLLGRCGGANDVRDVLAMTNDITPGTTIRGFQILSVDPTGKRVCVGCPCGSPHIVGIEALRGGAVVCAAAPLSPEQVAQQRTEASQQRVRRTMKDWRP